MLALPLVSLLAVWAAPPSPTPGAGPAVPDRRVLGPLHIEQVTRLTWPGLYLPAFTAIPGRRRVHRFTLGFEPRWLSLLSFDVVVAEPSDDADLRPKAPKRRAQENRNAYGWVGARLAVPRSHWALTAGIGAVVGALGSSGRTALRGTGGWQLNLVRGLR